MKKRTKKIISVGICMLSVAALLLTANTSDNIIKIGDGEVPLEEGIDKGTLVQQTIDDTMVKPDKYNTGAKGELAGTFPDTTINGIEFKAGSEYYVLDFFYKNTNVSGTVTFNNLDFSSYQLNMQHESMVAKNIKVVFNNCKFSKISTGKTASLVEYEFNDCTINSFYGSGATFNRCSFGGTYVDGLVPYQNVTVNDSYFSDFTSMIMTQKEVHSDGTQLYGSADVELCNIFYNNCRFEMPPVHLTGNLAYVNACIMFQVEFSNAKNVHFTNCTVNGGGYTLYARTTKEQFTLTDISFDGISVGCSKQYGTFYPTISSGISLANINDTENLYIGSVWKENSQTHVSVTNDTSVERTLLVETDNGLYSYTIPAGIPGKQITDSMSFSDFPIDIDIVIPSDCQYVICYDQTELKTKQIRYVNWTNKEVYLNALELSTIFGNVLNDDDIISSGSCGNDITYTLTAGGVLTLAGSGETYHYNSAKQPPFSEYKTMVKKVVISDGITLLGTQLFKGFSSISEVVLPSTLTSISKSAFQGCSSLLNINIPETVTAIGDYAFSGTIIQKITYLGSTDEWNTISIGANNSMLEVSKLFQPLIAEEQLPSEEIMTPYLMQDYCGPTIQYTLSIDGVLVLSGYGATYNYHSQKLAPWWDVRESIKKVIVEEGITTIGTQLFKQCTMLESVSLPASLTKIDGNAFNSCKALNEITIPVGVNYIGKYAFASTGLKKTVYNGTLASWNMINIGIKNEVLTGHLNYIEEPLSEIETNETETNETETSDINDENIEIPVSEEVITEVLPTEPVSQELSPEDVTSTDFQPDTSDVVPVQ